MSVLRLILREIAHRKLNFLLALIAIVTAVTLFVATLTLLGAMQKETTRLMRDLGFNVVILPAGTNVEEFWSQDYAREEMPEENVYKLADSKIMTIRHLVARLQKKIRWRDRDVLLTGVLPEQPMRHKAYKPPMGVSIPEGKVYLGYEIARGTGLKVGDQITITGATTQRFEVARVNESRGTKDDIRIYGHLKDVQKVLGKEGRINEIEALSCRCEGIDPKKMPEMIMKEIHAILPGAQVRMLRTQALACWRWATCARGGRR